MLFSIVSLVWGVPLKCKPGFNTLDRVQIIHTNDIHSHFDEFNRGGVDCKPKDKEANLCFGGFARIKTIVERIRADNPNALLLDAGDQFQGTLFFTYNKSKPIAKFMNALQYDAFTIGNHEFDLGQPELATFLSELNAPIISSNMNLNESLLKKSPIKPYIIIPKFKLGIIGFITKNTGEITLKTRDIKFLDPVAPVQKYIDELHSQGIYRIIGLSHNGYEDDQEVARQTRGLSAIIGGHSHSLLSNNASLAGVEGPYPTTVKNLENKDTLIVQAHRYGDYLGNLTLEWNSQNELVSISGNPILLDQSIPQDQEIQQQIDVLRKSFEPLTKQTLTVATEEFPACSSDPRIPCVEAELIADCMLQENQPADVAWTNTGGIRAQFPSGNVTTATILTVLPFGNVIAEYKATGKEIYDLLLGTSKMTNLKTGKRMISKPTFAGITFTNSSINPMISDVKIGGNALDLEKVYTVLTNDFTAAGGDSIIEKIDYTPGNVMADSVAACLSKKSSISPVSDGRVTQK